jgi:hypothetical protein
VLGLVDKDYGEVVCAVIVPHENVKEKAKQEKRPALTLEELSRFDSSNLFKFDVYYSNYIRFTQSYNFSFHHLFFFKLPKLGYKFNKGMKLKCAKLLSATYHS